MHTVLGTQQVLKKYLLNEYTHSRIFTEMRLFCSFPPTSTPCTIDIQFQSAGKNTSETIDFNLWRLNVPKRSSRRPFQNLDLMREFWSTSPELLEAFPETDLKAVCSHLVPEVANLESMAKGCLLFSISDTPLLLAILSWVVSFLE